jgi:hypothetical protein
LMVRTTANQIGSKPADKMIGSKIHAAIKITATGGKKKPAISNQQSAISKKIFTAPIRTQRFTSSVLFHSAIDWVIYRLDSI